MPRLLDPAARIPIVLRSDKDKPAPPTFYVRVLSKRMFAEFNDRYEATFHKPGEPYDESRYWSRYDLARDFLVGWENMPDPDRLDDPEARLPFAPERLEDLVDPFELRELLDQTAVGGQISYEDKKKSSSADCSSSDSSAETAAAESASTPPAD